jgi:hypothetical protein
LLIKNFSRCPVHDDIGREAGIHSTPRTTPGGSTRFQGVDNLGGDPLADFSIGRRCCGSRSAFLVGGYWCVTAACDRRLVDVALHEELAPLAEQGTSLFNWCPTAMTRICLP